MFSRFWMALMAVGSLTLGGVRPAHAQFAVIDVASLTQLVQDYQMLQQQLSTAESQLSQARSEYAAITGGRGMQNLLGGVQRNYLPTDWAQVTQLLSGSSPTYPALASAFTALVSANSVLTAAQVAALTPAQQADLAAARANPALLQTMARTALSNSSDRFAALQTLISAIGSAADQKASLDLSARITAEQGMLQNEATKLQVLYQVAESQESARTQRAREQGVADQGSLRMLPAMGL